MTYVIEVLISVLEHCLQIFSPGSIGPGKKRRKKHKANKTKTCNPTTKEKKQQVQFYVS
jgi:hypothetical protein